MYEISADMYPGIRPNAHVAIGLTRSGNSP